MQATTFKGPNLGTKLFILMSFILVVIPWFSYLYLSEMEDFLVESQANAQLLTAEGISTLLNGRSDLFNELPLSPDGYEQLYAHPLEKPIRIDGIRSDWEDVLDYNVGFGTRTVPDDRSQLVNQFYLVLGEHNGQVYAFVQVLDDTVIFRNRNILRLDLSDHIRVTFTGKDDKVQKLVITATEEGVTTAYAVDENWRYALLGEAENKVPGVLTQTANGYSVEFRIPLELLGSTKNFGLAVVDVDSMESRSIESITGTLPSAGREAFGLVLLKSPEVLRIIEGLGYSGANIQVIDAQQRVRAEVGSYRDASKAQQSPETGNSLPFLERLVNWLLNPVYQLVDLSLRDQEYAREDNIITEALKGNPGFDHLLSDDQGEMIIAAHPIIDQNAVIGTVILKQNTNRILEVRRDALKRIVNFSIVSVILFASIILGFSVRLAGRIRRLGTEANNAIDIYGRLKTNKISSETNSGDEIGDLARSISGMLARLHQHNQFLENMPRTLRHEINNPLNALSTSLQNLESQPGEEAKSKYIDSAKRGVNRIGMIVQNLADAASLEESLIGEEMEIINLHDLIKNYLANCRVVHPNMEFDYRGSDEPLYAQICDFRIEQLLDKLIDNAIDFATPGTTVVLSLTADEREISFSVENAGEPIPELIKHSLFDSMVTARDKNPDNRLHFGIGLYVVRVIADHHQGSVQAINLSNDSGVRVEVTLPRFAELERASATTVVDGLN
jgi:two-component system, OmpR family, sensor histidine kinase ChvG